MLLPWAGLGFAMLLFQIVARLAVPGEAVSALLILLVGLTAFGAGLATRLLWPQTGWLLFGVLVFAGLVGGALVERCAENQ